MGVLDIGHEHRVLFVAPGVPAPHSSVVATETDLGSIFVIVSQGDYRRSRVDRVSGRVRVSQIPNVRLGVSFLEFSFENKNSHFLLQALLQRPQAYQKTLTWYSMSEGCF